MLKFNKVEEAGPPLIDLKYTQILFFLISLPSLSSIFDFRLELYKVGKSALRWFPSYMRGRWQYVDVAGKQSKNIEVEICCFKGSISAPLHFILYTNNLVMFHSKLMTIITRLKSVLMKL